MNSVGLEFTPRHPWRALGLSLMSAGVGHVYAGQIRKGLLLYFAWLLIPLMATMAAWLPPTTFGLVTLLLIPIGLVVGVYLFAAIDAFRLAKRTSLIGYVLRD